MRATPFVSFSCWNGFFYDCKCYDYRWRKEILRNPHCLSAGSDSLYLQFKPTIWTLSHLRKHINCTISLQERQHHYATQKTSSSTVTENVTFAKLFTLQSPKFNVDKPTQRLGQRGRWSLLTYGLFHENVATFGPLPTKWFRLWNKRFTSCKLKKVYVLPNVECIFGAKPLSFGNLSLLTNFTKLSSVSNTVTIVHFN